MAVGSADGKGKLTESRIDFSFDYTNKREKMVVSDGKYEIYKDFAQVSKAFYCPVWCIACSESLVSQVHTCKTGLIF